MPVLSILRKALDSRAAGSKGIKASSLERRPVRLSFETLEDRLVPASNVAPVDPVLAAQILGAMQAQSTRSLSLGSTFTPESVRYVNASSFRPMGQGSGPYGVYVSISTGNFNTAADPKQSTLRLFEQWSDGRVMEMTMSTGALKDIDNYGSGRFNVVQNSSSADPVLYFSASDASSPQNNGRKYFYVTGADEATDPSDLLAKTVIQPLRINYNTTLRDSGYAYVANVGIPTGGDSLAKPTASTLRLFEVSGSKVVELTGAHARHASIRSPGNGLFSHWQAPNGSFLYLSSSDRTDPRLNRRSYVAVYTAASTDDRASTFVNGTNKQQTAILTTSDPTNRVIEISNTTTQTISGFRIAVDGSKFFQSTQDILNTIYAMVPAYVGEPMYQKIFRYVCENAPFDQWITNEQWLHEPLMMINSIGYGGCGDSAAVFRYLCLAAGYQSRIWGLNGHLVPEVLNTATNRWEMYDPCFCVFFKTAYGQVAGVEELAADHNLILRPYFRMQTNPRLSSGYSQVYANLYVNVFVTMEIPPIPSRSDAFSLPAGGKIAIGYQNLPQPIVYNGKKGTAVNPNLSITIPAGTAFTLTPYLALAGFRGNGKVIIDGVTYTIGSSALKALVNSQAKVYSSIKVIAGSGGATVDYWINGNLFDLEPQDGMNVHFVTLTSSTGGLTGAGNLQVGWKTI